MHGDHLVPAARDAVDRLAYSPTECAAALGLTRQTIHNLIARGELASCKIGRARRIPASELARLLGGTDGA
jgi:excisionase family DNA binding protein